MTGVLAYPVTVRLDPPKPTIAATAGSNAIPCWTELSTQS
jgi:hypothetical protein